MKVVIDRELCVGIGNCVAVAPAVFKLDTENKAVASDPSAVDEQKLRQAAESCPVAAITLLDDNGKAIYP